MQKIKMLAILITVCCSLAPTTWAMNQVDDEECDDEILFRPQAPRCNYIQLREMLLAKPKSFFDIFIENFKQNDMVELTIKNDQYVVDINDTLIAKLFLDMAASRNIVGIAQYLTDEYLKRRYDHTWLHQGHFGDALCLAVTVGSAEVAALIIEKVYERYGSCDIGNRLGSGIKEVFDYDNYDVAQALVDNERFVKAIQSDLEVFIAALVKNENGRYNYNKARMLFHQQLYT